MGKYNDEPRLHPATDERGGSCKFQVRCSPDWLRQIDIIVKSEAFPYVNRGEVVRDAIYRHFFWLENHNHTANSILQKIQSMADMLEEIKIQQSFETVLSQLEERVLYFGQKGARTEAIKYVLRVLGYIDDMPDGHWKQAFAKEVRDRYSGLLACMPRANLRNLVKEE